MDEFTKSILANHTYVYRYGAGHIQVWGTLNGMSVTRYAVEGLFASFVRKNTKKLLI